MSASILPGNSGSVYGGGAPGVPALIPFTFDGATFRVVELDGEPWFVGSDVAALLGYSQPPEGHPRSLQGGPPGRGERDVHPPPRSPNHHHP